MNKSDFFGDFMSAPLVPPPSIPTQQSSSLNQLSQNTNNTNNTNPYRDIIDNNTLYKKLLDIEFEISTIKAIISAIPNTRPIYYLPKPQEFQPQMISQIMPQQQGNIPQFWTTNTNTIWKTDQSIFK